MKPTIVDSHAHLSGDSFVLDQQEVIERAFGQGVIQIVQAGEDLQSIPQLLALSEEYPGIFSGVGLHPHEAKLWQEDSFPVLRAALKHPKVVAIGECGLDFHYNISSHQAQLHAFACQVRLARELNIPLIVHSRNAWRQTCAVLQEHGGGEVKGVFHCFTGGPEIIRQIEDFDFYVSFSGILTFANAKEIQAAAQLVVPERLLVETDCPYLAPHGFRGKRNEPAYVWLVAEKLADLRGLALKEIAEITSNNARKLFGLPKPQEAAV